MSKICVIGDGGWGTAIAMLLVDNGNDVTIWGPFADYIDEMRQTRKNPRYLAGVTLPDELKLEADMAKAVTGAEVVVLAVPSHFYDKICIQLADKLPKDCDVVSVSKGFCEKTRKRLTRTASKLLGIEDVVALSGPSHAEEVSRGIPTAVVAASNDVERVLRIQKLFSNKRFRVYTSTDTIGVELGGAIKNVLALAVGMSDGLGFGDNSRAALITRGLAEMARLGCVLGGNQNTFAGLSGIGDLVVTCTSRHSRNRGVGERLGKGETLEEICNGMQQVAEGIWNCDIVCELAQAYGVDMPICNAVKSVLDGEATPLEAVGLLMSRDSKHEHYGR